MVWVLHRLVLQRLLPFGALEQAFCYKLDILGLCIWHGIRRVNGRTKRRPPHILLYTNTTNPKTVERMFQIAMHTCVSNKKYSGSSWIIAMHGVLGNRAAPSGCCFWPCTEMFNVAEQ